MKITVITPTYNRRTLLPDVFESLCEQAYNDIEWIVVDDGGTDNSAEVVNDLRRKAGFSIKYIHKNNGGKHTAMNVGIQAATGELVTIVDDDDRFLPGAFRAVAADYPDIADNGSICCLSYLCLDREERVFGNPFPRDRMISNHIQCRINQNAVGDKLEFFKTATLKQFPFPVIEGERFLSEAVVWAQIGRSYQTLYINRPVLVKSYFGQGLSANWRQLTLQNPRGMALYYKLHLERDVRLKIRLRYMVAYVAMLRFLHKSVPEILRSSGEPLLSFICLLPGLVVGETWKLGIATEGGSTLVKKSSYLPS